MTARTRARLWLLDHLPDGVLARPGETFIGFLCLLSGIPIVLGRGDSPSLEALLPPLLYRGWGVALLIGAGALLVGIASIREPIPGGRHVILKVAAYRLGLRLLGISSLVYAGAIVTEVGLSGVIVPLVGFAAMCGIRLLTLGGR